MRLTRTARVCLVAAVVAVLAACSPAVSSPEGDSSAPAGDSAPGADATTVGVIAVGPKDDFGYNQAVYQGVEALREEFPDLDVLEAYNIPEDDTAATTRESMVAQGATIIFATSYGHLDAAKQVAEAHPEVVVVHQGGLLDPVPANMGTYFGSVFEPVYLAGIAAGAATTTGKLGYVYAIPIPQTLANINAFTLGAQSVRPDVDVTAVSTTSWCDPATQADRVASLLSSGVDVMTQHQDCTKTIIEATEAAGAYTVGYHADASSLAPEGWLTGSEWDWGPLYTDIVQTAIDGDFTGSEYNANYRANMASGKNPFVASAFGPSVTDETKALIAAAAADLEAGGSPFTGPVTAQDGTVTVPEGETPPIETIEQMDYFVQGVTGTVS
ncbi:BMP family ABC transporter substrate-binding protein [Cellulomonas humilata]|uniref:Simple sugar transport system substrate-binding protein/basic membrane protein A n=1 Tax=Cellulomonas humilata TaxID=144055 RepID=A0ABU0ECR2_9CELL|nr:BMP family ABC transporter substrate-binding protein [Cellulomonas humilata]MDQ0373054.1 simple sugar transport system substrate-binding protein/basic membrane protein A [Cellulomonas humilata]